MSIVEEIVSDEEIEKVWGNANFGDRNKRDLIRHCLLTYSCNLRDGYTILSICRDLGLIELCRGKLTKKGKWYMYSAFCEENNQ